MARSSTFQLVMLFAIPSSLVFSFRLIHFCYICEPHPCPCGAMVASREPQGLSCKRSSDRSTRHQQINDAIWRALKRADVPSTKEQAGLLRGDGKRPDGLTLVPWQSGRSLTWDVTVVDTLANSYTPTTSVTSCGAAESAATRKRVKYAEIIQSHHFVPIAIETLGSISIWMVNASLIASANAFLPFPAIQVKPHSYTKDYLYLSKFSMRLSFVVLSFSRQLPKVNSRTRF